MIIPNGVPSHPEVKKLNGIVVQWIGQHREPVVSIQTDDLTDIEFLRERAMEIVELYK